MEVIERLVGEAVDDVVVGGGGGGDAGALRESGEAVLDDPALSHGVVVPGEGDAVGSGVACGEAGDVGADSGGEGDGVAPVTLEEVDSAEGADGGIVGHAGSEAADGGGTGADAVGAVETAGVPDVDVPVGLVAVDVPVEVGCGVGDGGGVEAVGREAGQAVGDEAVDDPVAEAEAVGAAVLTHTEGVGGGRTETGEGVGGAGDGDVGGRPVGSGTFLDVDFIVVAVAGPGDGGRVVGVGGASDGRTSATSSVAGDELEVADIVAGAGVAGGGVGGRIGRAVLIGVAGADSACTMGVESGAATVGAVPTDDSEEDVAVTVPGEGGVEAVELPTGGGIAHVAVGDDGNKDVVGVGHDIASGEVSLGYIGHVDGHVSVVVALVACAGAESEGGDGIDNAGHLCTVDEGLDIAIVIEAVAHGAVVTCGGGHGTVVAVGDAGVVAESGLEGYAGPAAGIGAVVTDAADADVVVGEVGEAGDGSAVGEGGDGGCGGNESRSAVSHLVVVGTVGVPNYMEFVSACGECGVLTDVEDAAGGADAADVEGETVVGVDGAVGVEVDGEGAVGGQERRDGTGSGAGRGEELCAGGANAIINRDVVAAGLEVVVARDRREVVGGIGIEDDVGIL